MRYIILPLFCVLLYRQFSAAEPAPAGPLLGFLQTNLIGFPVIHEKAEWLFDPDVSLRRRKQFRELHGDKGEYLIERLGLGIDGYEEQRLTKQRQRDEGHLGGLNNFLP